MCDTVNVMNLMVVNMVYFCDTMIVMYTDVTVFLYVDQACV